MKPRKKASGNGDVTVGSVCRIVSIFDVCIYLSVCLSTPCMTVILTCIGADIEVSVILISSSQLVVVIFSLTPEQSPDNLGFSCVGVNCLVSNKLQLDRAGYNALP